MFDPTPKSPRPSAKQRVLFLAAAAVILAGLVYGVTMVVGGILTLLAPPERAERPSLQEAAPAPSGMAIEVFIETETDEVEEQETTQAPASPPPE